MNTVNTHICISEQNVRNIAQNLKNLLNLAESQNYPFENITYPSHLTILNAIAQTFGFNTIKGMSVELEGDLVKEKEISELKPFDLSFSIKKKNPDLTNIGLFEANHFIKTLFNQLILNPISKTDEQLLARLQCKKLNHITSQVIFMLEFKTHKYEDLLISDLIKVAQYSNILYYSHLIHCGMPETFSIDQQLNFNIDRGDKFVADWSFSLHVHMTKSNDHQVSNIINGLIPKSNGQFKANFNPNQKFVETMSEKLRSFTISQLMAQKSTQLTGSMLLNFGKNSNARNQVIDQNNLTNLMKANIRVIKFLVGKMKVGCDKIEDFEFDANGLLTPKYFAVLFHVYQANKQYDFAFKNLNTFYWMIQKLSAGLLLNDLDQLNRITACYINDIYNNFSPIVQEHYDEVHSDEFDDLYKSIWATMHLKKININ